MNTSSEFRCRTITLSILIMLVSSILSVQIPIISPVEAGKYGDIEPTNLELELLAKINENRTNNGAGVLKLNSSLVWVARAHSQDMIDYDFLEHNSSVGGQFNGATFSERVNNYAEYEDPLIGECIAVKSWGIDPEAVMDSWKNSPPHWSIIINPGFEEIGIGLVEGEWSGSPNAGLHTAVFGGGSISVDLTLGSSDIDFIPSSPHEGQDVNISAVIHNLGSTDAYPVIVKFYDGDPLLGGTQIGSDKQIPHILIHGEYTTVNVNWDTTGKAGNHDIYVVVDEDNIISETNEGNNKAFKTLNINGSIPPIHLKEGWNLVSFPFITSDKNLENVLSSISGDYDKVLLYNSSDSLDYWKQYHTSKPLSLNDLNELDNKIGFWIHITNPTGADLFTGGDDPSSPQHVLLKAGWNMVGYPSNTTRSRDDALNNLDFENQVDVIQYYDTSTGRIKNLEISDNFEPGKGYWIYATQNCEWIVNN